MRSVYPRNRHWLGADHANSQRRPVAPPDARLAQTVFRELVRLTTTHLHKDPKLTAIAVSFIDPDHWFVGGLSLAGHRADSFWLDIKVVDGTNTKSELARDQSAVFAMLQRVLGNLHEESYILVQGVPAAACAFGGKSQEYRFIAAELGTAA